MGIRLAAFAKHYRKSPLLLGSEEVRRFLLHNANKAPVPGDPRHAPLPHQPTEGVGRNSEEGRLTALRALRSASYVRGILLQRNDCRGCLRKSQDPLGFRPEGMQVAHGNEAADIETDGDVNGLPERRVAESCHPICVGECLEERAVMSSNQNDRHLGAGSAGLCGHLNFKGAVCGFRRSSWQ